MDSHLILLFHAHNFHPNAGPPAAFKASAANTSLLPKPCRALPSTARRASRARRSTAANMRSSTSENRCNRRHQCDWAFGSTHCWLLLYLWDLHGSTFDFAWIYFHSGQVRHCQLHHWHSINWCFNFKSRRFKIRNSIQGIVVGRIDPQRWLGTAGEITGKEKSRYL